MAEVGVSLVDARVNVIRNLRFVPCCTDVVIEVTRARTAEWSARYVDPRTTYAIGLQLTKGMYDNCEMLLCSHLLFRSSARLSRSSARHTLRLMATVRSSLPHEQRTAAQPRENRVEPVILSHIREVNEDIRLLRLSAVDPGHSIKVR